MAGPIRPRRFEREGKPLRIEVAVFNGSLWHSSYRNHSSDPRRTLHCAFIAREHPQQTNQRVVYSFEFQTDTLPGHKRSGDHA